jgi:hypothetical protein
MVDLGGGVTICVMKVQGNVPGGPASGRPSRPLIQPESPMTTFDERKNAFEKKFALDQDLKFRAESRRNKMLAEWAGAKLGLSGTGLEDYVKAVRKADLEEKGDDDVFRKVQKDLKEKGIAVNDTEIREAMLRFLETAVTQIQSESK